MAAGTPSLSAVNVHSVSKVKKFIEEPTTVEDALVGLAMSNTGLVILENQRIIIRRDHAEIKGKVKLISGGGAGNEPAHSGFIGPGMLTAAVVGNIYNAPPSSTILRAIRELGRNYPEGILLIITNYSGNRLNFGLAMERARNEGIRIKMLVVGEDCSMLTADKTQGRRGLAGVVLIHKLAGGMAEEGRTLDDIFTACSSALMSDMATIGVGLRLSVMPRRSSQSGLIIDSTSSELELGVGIHGEPGVHKISMMKTAEIVHIMLEHMMNPASETHIELDTSYPVAVLINNMGGSSKLEEHIFAMETLKQISSQGFKASRVYCGMFLTSLETVGFSITVFKIKTPDIIKYLDAPTSAPGWPCSFSAEYVIPQDILDKESHLPIFILGTYPDEEEATNKISNMNVGPKMRTKSAHAVLQVLDFATDAVSACEFQLNQFDAEAGDGDTGTILKKGAEALKYNVKTGKIVANRPFALLENISVVLEKSMGGTSGALYSIFFASAAQPFKNKTENYQLTAQDWLEALQAGIQAIARYGQANVGDRTMLDALNSAAVVLENELRLNPEEPIEALEKAAAAAEEGAQKTIGKKAIMGKASENNKDLPLLLPDPGAHAVGIWMRAVYEACRLLFNC